MLLPALHHYFQLAVMSPPTHTQTHTLCVAAGIITMSQQRALEGAADTVEHAVRQRGPRRRTSSPESPAAAVSDAVVAEPLQNTSRSERVRFGLMASSQAALHQQRLHAAEPRPAISRTEPKEGFAPGKPSIFPTPAYSLWPHSNLLTNQRWKRKHISGLHLSRRLFLFNREVVLIYSSQNTSETSLS